MDLPLNANRRVLSGRARDWLALAGLAALVLALRLPSLFMSEINMDDSVFMIYGRTMMKGGIPYVDFWDHHPLGGMVLFGLAGRIFGYSYLTLRWFTIGAVILGCFVIYLVGSTLGRRTRAIGLVAALIFAVYSLNNLGLAADRVFFHVPLVGVAFYWFLSRTPLLDRARPGGRMSAPKLLAIGLLMGLSMQIKALYAADYVPLALLIALEVWQEQRSKGRRVVGEIARAWALLAGPAVILLLVNVAYFAYQGRLDIFVYANLTAPSIYAGATPTSLGRIIGKFAWQITSNPLAWMGLLIAPLYLILARDVERVERRSFALLGFWFIFPLMAVLAARRLDGHHFLQLLAPLSLFTGLLLAGLLRLARQPIDGRQTLAVLFILLSYPDIAHLWERGRDRQNPGQPFYQGPALASGRQRGRRRLSAGRHPAGGEFIRRGLQSGHLHHGRRADPYAVHPPGLLDRSVVRGRGEYRSGSSTGRDHGAEADLRGGSGAAEP